MFISNADQIREADQIQIQDMEFPGILLMETAGRVAAETLLRLYPDQSDFIVLAGPGNNGGDGLVIARYLHLSGRHVQVYLSHDQERFQGDAAINFRILRHLPIAWGVWNSQHSDRVLDESHPPVIIDALLGTGIDSSLRDPVASMISYWQQKNLSVVAIDLPSGLDANTGKRINAVLKATHTLTFQLPKLCHYITPAANMCGEIHVLDIGLWPSVIERLNIKRSLLNDEFVKNHYIGRPQDGHKGTFGHVLIVGGSSHMGGAVAMTAYAALKAGAGLSTVVCPEACRAAVYALSPEVMCRTLPQSNQPYFQEEDSELVRDMLNGKSVVVMGPGMGTDPNTGKFLEQILPHIQVPVLLDADALNLLAQSETFESFLNAQTILTPHPGELQRLIGESVTDRRLEFVESFVQDNPSILLLKGAGTLIALPDGRTFINTSGNPGMATAGSGDVLSGIIGGLVAQGYDPEIATPMGVYLHGKTGDLLADRQGMEGIIATQIAESLSEVWMRILRATT